MTTDSIDGRNRWAGAWPDALAFVIGLALAWQFQWETRDLVWSLWLSSFVIGYAMIVWGIFGPGAEIARAAWRGRAELVGAPKMPAVAGGAVLLAGGLFLLAFFTVHFGGFHFVHSVFLNSFFPVEPGTKSFPGPALYWEVFLRYWWFLPAAAIAERSAFRMPSAPSGRIIATNVNIAALCDVDEAYAAHTVKEYPGRPFYKDYRVMLDNEKGLDAVMCATPDHWHAPISLAAMRLGKHVYCEKPLAHTIAEVRAMRRAALEKKVITQVGNQGHSSALRLVLPRPNWSFLDSRDYRAHRWH